jgi:hypothetical protein
VTRSGAQSAGGGKVADHSLLDQTSGDTGARCRTINSRPFIFYLSVRAINAAATVRIHFQDGSFIDYPLAENESFSLQQAAGTTDGVDNRIRVRSAPGSAGSLVGWVSASRVPGTTSRVVATRSAKASDGGGPDSFRPLGAPSRRRPVPRFEKAKRRTNTSGVGRGPLGLLRDSAHAPARVSPAAQGWSCLDGRSGLVDLRARVS